MFCVWNLSKGKVFLSHTCKGVFEEITGWIAIFSPYGDVY